MSPTFTQEKPQRKDSTTAITSPASGAVTPTNVPTQATTSRPRPCFGGVGGAVGSEGLGPENWDRLGVGRVGKLKFLTGFPVWNRGGRVTTDRSAGNGPGRRNRGDQPVA